MQQNMLWYFEAGAARHHPDKTAIMDGATATTFAQLRARALTLAGRLLGASDVLHQPIAVYLPKSADAVVADLAVLYTGNIFTNLDVKSPLC